MRASDEGHLDRHPDDRDLVNFVRDEIGGRKKEKILEHCRRCQPCADRLIEATREHAPDPGPMRLTRWNKIWLGALVVALIVLVLTFVLLLRGLQTPPVDPLPTPLEQGVDEGGDRGALGKDDEQAQ